MRQLLSFPCEGATLGGTLDGAEGRIGVLIVTGGSQTRIGSHRMFERLAAALAADAIPASASTGGVSATAKEKIPTFAAAATT